MGWADPDQPLRALCDQVDLVAVAADRNTSACDRIGEVAKQNGAVLPISAANRKRNRRTNTLLSNCPTTASRGRLLISFAGPPIVGSNANSLSPLRAMDICILTRYARSCPCLTFAVSDRSNPGQSGGTHEIRGQEIRRHNTQLVICQIEKKQDPGSSPGSCLGAERGEEAWRPSA